MPTASYRGDEVLAFIGPAARHIGRLKGSRAYNLRKALGYTLGDAERLLTATRGVVIAVENEHYPNLVKKNGVTFPFLGGLGYRFALYWHVRYLIARGKFPMERLLQILEADERDGQEDA